ncbi:MAG: TetR/AcrR family transcriptional regulator [Deferribacterales bacterium]
MAKNLLPDKKNLLIDSAVEVFSEKGYWNTKISDIVKKADVAQGTFYLYFKNKEDLFKEMLLKLHNDSVEEMNKLLSQKTENHLDTLLYFLLQKFHNRKKLIKVFLYETLSVGIEFVEILKHFRKVTSEFIADAIKEDYPEIENDTLLRKSFIVNAILREYMELNIITENRSFDTSWEEIKTLMREIIP